MAKHKKKHKKAKQSPVNYTNQQKLNEEAPQQAPAEQTAMQACVTGQFNFQFQALDTWFFRESRPHDAVGASELSSLFPPPMRTLIGAVRSFIGERLGVDWRAFSDAKNQPYLINGVDFKQAVGGSDDLGQLTVMGAWLCSNGERLYPAPGYLMQKETELTRLQIGDQVRCDLGTVRLPELPQGLVAYKTVEQAWLKSSGLEKLLQQQLPDKKDLVFLPDVLAKEPRLGIARHNAARAVVESQLYQTQHIRLHQHVSIELDVQGLPEALADVLPKTGASAIVRLGGEGRMASLTIKQQHDPMPGLDITVLKPVDKIIIHFITAADFGGAWLPEDFKKTDHDGQTVWEGDINGIALRIEAAVIGKVHREGGWDMQKHQPRAVKSYLPAGSAWFCEVIDKTIPWSTLLNQLHNRCIGRDTAYGRGHILIGLWHDGQTTQQQKG